VRLHLWRPKKPRLLLDLSPTGEQEERNLFDNPVENPIDLNTVLIRERLQDMGERVLYADRAFVITIVWVAFLIAFPFVQMIGVRENFALSDAAFITVTTTTTASIFGFWLLVGQYLYYRPN
jgi:hypothetical protein